MGKNIENIPKCPKCAGFTRPNVSFFSDTNETFDDQRISEQKQKFMEWLNPFIQHKNKQLLVVEIGCGKSVHSLRWECQYLASLDHINLIRINPTENLSEKNKTKILSISNFPQQRLWTLSL